MFLLVSPMASGNMKMGIITECIQQLIIKLLNVPAWSPGLFFKIRIRQKQCTHVELLFTFTMYIFWLSVKQIPITFFLNPHYQTTQEKNHGCARAERRSTPALEFSHLRWVSFCLISINKLASNNNSAELLSNILAPSVGNTPHHIGNPQEFVSTKGIQLEPDETVVSYDVTFPFVCIPTSEMPRRELHQSSS